MQTNLVSVEQNIKNQIFTIRDMQVMIDRDLAEFYGVQTKILNQAVKRNTDRFPIDFMFQLTKEEYELLRSQIVTLKEDGRGKHRKYLPYVFTEQGVSMLASVLKSTNAVKMSIAIVRAFVQMRKLISNNTLVFDKIDHIEKKLFQHDKKFEEIFKSIEQKDLKPKQGIFFDGQIFDAYLFISKLVKSAKNSIILVDNYIDESVLLQLSSQANNDIKITILTKDLTKILQQDLKKHNAQYRKIEIKKFTLSHDRFLIIDQNEIYHIGASLKDLGKKWFAFSKIDEESVAFMDKIKESIS